MHRTRRVLAYSATTLVGLAAVATVTAAPAHADSTISLYPSIWAYVDSQAPKTSFVNPTGDAPIGTTIGADSKAHTYRSYFTYDLSQYQDVAIHRATWFTYESSVNDCTAAAPVELWRTKPVKTTTTWNNQPEAIERLRQYDRGAGIPCPAYLGPQLLAEINAALARHEKSVTFELRIAQAKESDPTLGRTWQKPGLGLSYNHVPKITELGVVGASKPCGTLTKYPTANNYAQLMAKWTDADPQSYASVRFAVWSVAHPDQRLEFTGGGYGSGQSQGSTNLSQFPEGDVLAFSAQADDSWDKSEWAKPCYFTVDRTAPAKAPAVASSLYREGTVANGGPGVKGKFRFDAEGDRDVVSFAWRDNTGPYGHVDARRPGGTAVFEYTPTRFGTNRLVVASIDAAGNRGPETTYEFEVRNTAPWAQVDVAGVGMPSQITLHSPAPEANAYSYQLDGGTEVKFPAGTDGIGRSQITFTRAGYQNMTVRAYNGNKMLGSDRVSVSVSDAPLVDSTDFTLFDDVVVGKTGTFTFKPRAVGVKAYVYDFGDGVQQRVGAAADGTASVQWTAENPGWVFMTIQSELADGSLSQSADYQFNVIDNRPTAYATDLVSYPRTDGVGIPLQLQLESLLPNVTGFAYQFDGGTEQTTATGSYAQVEVTPTHAGDNAFVLQALLSDGTRSPARSMTLNIYSGPQISYAPDGDGLIGRPVTFTFRPGLPGVTEYHFSADSEQQTVTAGPDGTATLTFTPAYSTNVSIKVSSVSADGTVSQTRERYFNVLDTRVQVYSSYYEGWPNGGIGTDARFTFYSQRRDLVEFVYHVNDGPEQSLPVSVNSTSTDAMITLSRNGLNTLYVRCRDTAGELSPVTEYRFSVGTAPHVVSAQYPNGTWAGGAGVAGTFEFSLGTDGIVSFDYQLDWGTTTTVAADAAGRASATYTPAGDFETHTMTVIGHKADGTATDSTTYYIYVSNLH